MERVPYLKRHCRGLSGLNCSFFSDHLTLTFLTLLLSLPFNQSTDRIIYLSCLNALHLLSLIHDHSGSFLHSYSPRLWIAFSLKIHVYQLYVCHSVGLLIYQTISLSAYVSDPSAWFVYFSLFLNCLLYLNGFSFVSYTRSFSYHIFFFSNIFLFPAFFAFSSVLYLILSHSSFSVPYQH